MSILPSINIPNSTSVSKTQPELYFLAKTLMTIYRAAPMPKFPPLPIPIPRYSSIPILLYILFKLFYN